MKQNFWKRFSQEYVTSLQSRSKWFKNKPKFEIGQLALLQDDSLPPMKWKLGRIILPS
jgi:hypothetical protein